MIQITPRIEASKFMTFASPLLAILLTLIFGSILFTVLDKDPLEAMHLLLIAPLSDAYNISEMLVKMGPLLLCAVGLSLCYRANLWNIGAEGQLLMGALGGSAVALQFVDSEAWFALPLTLIADRMAAVCDGYLSPLVRSEETNIDQIGQWMAGTFIETTGSQTEANL